MDHRPVAAPANQPWVDRRFFRENSMFEFDIAPTSILAFGMPGIPELLIIMAIFLLLFGGTKLPSLMRNLGRSVNEFKTGIKEAPTDAGIEDGSDKD